MNKYDPEYIDEEEKDLMDSLDGINLQDMKKPSDDEQKEFKASAKSFIRNNTKMNIRIDPLELEKIKEEAARSGLKYQTFVKSVLHKYLTGQLVEKDKIAG